MKLMLLFTLNLLAIFSCCDAERIELPIKLNGGVALVNCELTVKDKVFIEVMESLLAEGADGAYEEVVARLTPALKHRAASYMHSSDPASVVDYPLTVTYFFMTKHSGENAAFDAELERLANLFAESMMEFLHVNEDYFGEFVLGKYKLAEAPAFCHIVPWAVVLSSWLGEGNDVSIKTFLLNYSEAYITHVYTRNNFEDDFAIGPCGWTHCWFAIVARLVGSQLIEVMTEDDFAMVINQVGRLECYLRERLLGEVETSFTRFTGSLERRFESDFIQRRETGACLSDEAQGLYIMNCSPVARAFFIRAVGSANVCNACYEIKESVARLKEEGRLTSAVLESLETSLAQVEELQEKSAPDILQGMVSDLNRTLPLLVQRGIVSSETADEMLSKFSGENAESDEEMA